jgi:hypothetical protein
MKQLSAIALATMLAAGSAFGQTVSTEKTVTKTSADGVVTEKTETTEQTETAYVTRTGVAYKEAGLPSDIVVKLRDYDAKIVAARRANDLVRVREYYDAQTRLLTPTQLTSVRTYLRSHPVATGERVVTVWEDEPVVTKEVREVRTPVERRVETRPVEVRVGPVKAGVGVGTTEKTEEVRTETTVRTTTE